MKRTDQNKLDQLCLRLGSIQSWQQFMLIGGVLVAINVSASVGLTYFVMQGQELEAVYRALVLSFILPLILVTLAWIVLNRILVVMTRANLNLRRAADIDSLTRLSNRAAFYRRGREIFDQIQRLNHHGATDPHSDLEKNLALVMIDIDHFKQINDKYGHLAGDQALSHMAKIIGRCCRDADMPARWGGEEFAILLEDANRNAAIQVAERIREVTNEEPFIWEGKPVYITLSAGVTEISSQDQKLEDIVLRADLALYHAKASGRNKVHAPHIAAQDLQEKQQTADLAGNPALQLQGS